MHNLIFAEFVCFPGVFNFCDMPVTQWGKFNGSFDKGTSNYGLL
jgi:hypothetical protein